MPRVTHLAAEPHHDGSPATSPIRPRPSASASASACAYRPASPPGPSTCAPSSTGSRSTPRPRWSIANRETTGRPGGRARSRSPTRSPPTASSSRPRTASAGSTAPGRGAATSPTATTSAVATFDPPPDWLADTVCYQIFPDRFARSASTSGRGRSRRATGRSSATGTPRSPPDWRTAVRQLYRGDLVGVRQRLDHLERLGVNLLYLTPVLPGAVLSHRYDASTFDHVDPVLGGDAALAALVDAAHARGIRVIGDLTTNHSGDHHAGSRRRSGRRRRRPRRGYYFFTEHPHGYVGWFDVPSLPKFDLRSPALRTGSSPGRTRSSGAGSAGRQRRPRRLAHRRRQHDRPPRRRSTSTTTCSATCGARWPTCDPTRGSSPSTATTPPPTSRGDGWHGVMAYSWFTRPVWSWLRPSRRPGLIGVPGPAAGDRRRRRSSTRSGRSPPACRGARSTASMTLLDSHDTARFAHGRPLRRPPAGRRSACC